MRICVLGSGNQGVAFAGLLTREEDVDEIILVDRELDIAKKAADRIQGLNNRNLKIDVASADAGDINMVSKIVTGADVVFHAILPKYNLPIMRACLNAGASYCDLLSYSSEVPGVPREESLEAQLELDQEFKKAGLIAIPCLGISPGWTTLTAKFMVNQLEKVDKVIIRNVDWLDSDDILAPAPPEVILGMWLGPPNPVCMMNGQVTEVDLLASEETYAFPAPVGKQKIYASTLNIESILLRGFAGKEIGCIEEKGAVISGGLETKDIWIRAIQQQTSRHKGAEDMLALFGKSYKPIDELNFKDGNESTSIKDAAFTSSIEVIGENQGEKVRRTINCVVTLDQTRQLLPWALPGVYATIGGVSIEVVLMMGRKQLANKGVIPLSEIENPELILKNIKKRGFKIYEKIERE